MHGAEYALGFCTPAAGNAWNESALKDVFCQDFPGLAHWHDHLASTT